MAHAGARTVSRLLLLQRHHDCLGRFFHCSALTSAELKASDIKNADSVSGTVERLAARLAAAGVPEPGLSSRYLVSQVLGKKSANACLAAAAAGATLTADQCRALERLVHCRLSRMPLQYIAGDWDFRRITLATRPPVFIPRPETEQLVDLVLEHIMPHHQQERPVR